MSDEMNERLVRLEATQAEIKAMLAQFFPILVKLSNDVAEMKGRMADMPTARDFGRLEGRVAEISERLPTVIGYHPPESRRAVG